MAVRMWWCAGILLGLVILAIVGYLRMIAVKPSVARPAMADTDRAEIQALGLRLMEHVRVLGEIIGERNLFRPSRREEFLRYSLADGLQDTEVFIGALDGAHRGCHTKVADASGDPLLVGKCH